MVEADCARDAALRSLIADALALIASIAPAPVSLLRHQARRSRTGAELGLYEPQPGMDWHAYFEERAALLEHAMSAVGMPHQSAVVVALPQRRHSPPFHGPARIVPFVR